MADRGRACPHDNARDVPDVALPASPDHDGYLFFTGGKLQVVGGTSAGAPTFAGDRDAAESLPDVERSAGGRGTGQYESAAL